MQIDRESTWGNRLRVNAGGTTLLLLVASCAFVVPVSPPAWHHLLYPILYSGILVMAALALEQRRPMLVVLAVGLVALEWWSLGSGHAVIHATSLLSNGLFFVFVVSRLIGQIARTHEVNPRTIVAAVNGYLLLGLAASIAISLVTTFDPDAIAFPDPVAGASEVSDQVYFGFVTLTTVGYGDVVPKSPHAKSLATLIGVVGQMYVAIVIATLVGKWASRHRADR